MSTNTTLVRFFIILQISGSFAFALIVFSALLFRNVKRHPVWFSFCLSWVVFGLSYSLLAFSGEQFSTPGRDICITQATLVYAAPFLSGTASVALVIHLLLNILSALSRAPVKKTYPVLVTLVIAAPWLMWTTVFVGILIVNLKSREHVEMSRNGTYCVISKSPVPRLTAISSTIFAVAIIAFEAVIAFLLYRHRAIKDIFKQSQMMAIRVFVFTAVGFSAVVVGMIFTVTKTRGIAFDVMIATLPPSTAVIFGTQMDLWVGWMFWKRFLPRNPPPSPTTVGTITVPWQRTISIRRISSDFSSTNSSMPAAPVPTPLTSTNSEA